MFKKIIVLSVLISFTMSITLASASISSTDRVRLIEMIMRLIQERKALVKSDNSNTYLVSKIVDGDTLDVNINGVITRIRLIGIDTPEVVDPRKPVECFGKEASEEMKELVLGKKVRLERDSSQDDKDKYGRLLRYLFTEDNTNINLQMILGGYAHEYTYLIPYRYQASFKKAEKEAKDNGRGLWSSDACKQEVVSSCSIKGNINSNKEKIYHLPNCPSYNQTVINTDSGEKWFCSETEAISAGWRKAGNCQ